MKPFFLFYEKKSERNTKNGILRKFNSDRVQKCQKPDKNVKFDRINQV